MNTTFPQACAFNATRWTLVLTAQNVNSAAAEVALEELCRMYWYPLYAYVRRCGHERHDAEDLTQGFFARLLAKNDLADVDRGKGRFRSFLLSAMKHFLANERDRQQAQKRGGDSLVIPLDVIAAESRRPLELVDGLTPEKMFERQWALTLLDRVLNQLSAELTAEGKAEIFSDLKEFLVGNPGPRAASGLAVRLGISEGTMKVTIHRLRRRYRTLLRDEIAQTVANPAEVDEEIHRLFAAFE
ncbi:MAG: ECF-type sigma factor [Chthoniobacterales bacterium]